MWPLIRLLGLCCLWLGKRQRLTGLNDLHRSIVHRVERALRKTRRQGQGAATHRDDSYLRTILAPGFDECSGNRTTAIARRPTSQHVALELVLLDGIAVFPPKDRLANVVGLFFGYRVFDRSSIPIGLRFQDIVHR